MLIKTIKPADDFVEHKSMKCIIIANEKEINKTSIENYELKIMTALSDKIEFCEKRTIMLISIK